jgi:hypothetical protein
MVKDSKKYASTGGSLNLTTSNPPRRRCTIPAFSCHETVNARDLVFNHTHPNIGSHLHIIGGRPLGRGRIGLGCEIIAFDLWRRLSARFKTYRKTASIARPPLSESRPWDTF